jgi:hypothetical protein
MDQIHLSPLVDQIQLTLGHISNRKGRRIGRAGQVNEAHARVCLSQCWADEDRLLCWSSTVGIKGILGLFYVLKRGQGKFLFKKGDIMPILVNVCTFRWYLQSKPFSCSLRKSYLSMLRNWFSLPSIGSTKLIPPYSTTSTTLYSTTILRFYEMDGKLVFYMWLLI